MGIISKVGWHAGNLLGVLGGLQLLKARLSLLSNQQKQQESTNVALTNFWELSWREFTALLPALHHDLFLKLDNLFAINQKMTEIEKYIYKNDDENESDTIKKELWSELGVLILSRHLTWIYSSLIMDQFLCICWSLIGKHLFIQQTANVQRPPKRSGKKQEDSESPTIHRLLLCIATRFVQNGTSLLSKSIINATRTVVATQALESPCTIVTFEAMFTKISQQITNELISECMWMDTGSHVVGIDSLDSHDRSLFIAMLTDCKQSFKAFTEIRLQEHACKEIKNKFLALGSRHEEVPFVSTIPKISSLFKLWNFRERESFLKNELLRMYTDYKSTFVRCFCASQVNQSLGSGNEE